MDSMVIMVKMVIMIMMVIKLIVVIVVFMFFSVNMVRTIFMVIANKKLKLKKLEQKLKQNKTGMDRFQDCCKA
jgi:hypothetical protein